MVIIEREMLATFTDLTKREIENWGHNMNCWLSMIEFINFLQLFEKSFAIAS